MEFTLIGTAAAVRGRRRVVVVQSTDGTAAGRSTLGFVQSRGYQRSFSNCLRSARNTFGYNIVCRRILIFFFFVDGLVRDVVRDRHGKSTLNVQ